jgi:hypothetical protein
MGSFGENWTVERYENVPAVQYARVMFEDAFGGEGYISNILTLYQPSIDTTDKQETAKVLESIWNKMERLSEQGRSRERRRNSQTKLSCLSCVHV